MAGKPMFLQIDNYLTAAEVRDIAELARQAKFLEGRRSNPHNQTKDNVIGDPADPMAQKASQIALTALQRNEQSRNFAFPQRMAVPSLARYDVGMKYGAHIDAAFMPLGPQPLRSDVSCTMFISNPSDYEGGELVIYLGSEIVHLKGNAGSAVFYASTNVHQVEPVRSGSRLVMITFIESQIPDPLQRDLLFSLGEVRALEAAKMEWRTRTQLDYVFANLQRMWSR
jgi:PKHD-type hydroxylase